MAKGPRQKSPTCKAFYGQALWNADVPGLRSQADLQFATAAYGKALTLIKRQGSFELR